MSRPARRRYERPESVLVNHNINALSGRTSLRLEGAFWDAFQGECARRGLTASALVREIESALPDAPRTNAVRVWLLTRMRERAETAERALATDTADPALSPHASGIAS